MLGLGDQDNGCYNTDMVYFSIATVLSFVLISSVEGALIEVRL